MISDITARETVALLMAMRAPTGVHVTDLAATMPESQARYTLERLVERGHLTTEKIGRRRFYLCAAAPKRCPSLAEMIETRNAEMMSQ